MRTSAPTSPPSPARGKDVDPCRTLLDSLGDPCLALDRNLRIVYCNPAYAAVLRRDTEDLLGETWPADTPLGGGAFRETCLRVLETGVRQEGEEEAAGRVLHVRAYPTPEGVLALFTDITPRRQLEEELLQAARRSRLLLEQLPALHWTVDRDLRFQSSRGGPLQNLDLLPGQVKGQTLYEYFQTTDPGCIHIQVHRRALQGERVRYTSTHGGRHFECVVDPLRDPHGAIIGVVGLAHDVTERYQAEEERSRLQQVVYQTQKLESLGVLASGIAHDFNNLLVGLLGTADLLLRDLPAGSPQRPLAELLKKAGERAAHLTRQMLVYAGKGPAVRQPLDCNVVVRDTLPLLAAGLPKNVLVTTALASPLPPVQGDPGQWQQVVVNLILNGAEAAGGGSGCIRVSTAVADVSAGAVPSAAGGRLAPGRYVVLEVADNGSGMTPEVLARIFDPFFTTKGEGRGLGLSAVQGIVRAYRGGIQIDSAPGRGTTFRVFMPAGVAAATPPPVCLPNRPRQGLVLVVDDEAFMRDVAGRALTAIGLRVLTAANGDEALALFQAHRNEVGVVLLDLVMPGLDSALVLASLRQLRPDVPVIIASGYDRGDVLSRFDPRDLAGFLQKPYQLDTLLSTVARALARPDKSAP